MVSKTELIDFHQSSLIELQAVRDMYADWTNLHPDAVEENFGLIRNTVGTGVGWVELGRTTQKGGIGAGMGNVYIPDYSDKQIMLQLCRSGAPDETPHQYWFTHNGDDVFSAYMRLGVLQFYKDNLKQAGDIPLAEGDRVDIENTADGVTVFLNGMPVHVFSPAAAIPDEFVGRIVSNQLQVSVPQISIRGMR